MSSYLSGSLSVTNSTAGSYSKNKLAVKRLPEGPSIPHRRCPRGQLGGGGGSGSCSSLSPPCRMYGGRYIAPADGLPVEEYNQTQNNLTEATEALQLLHRRKRALLIRDVDGSLLGGNRLDVPGVGALHLFDDIVVAVLH